MSISQGREDLVVAAQCERYRRTAAQAVGMFDSDLATAPTKAEFVNLSRLLDDDDLHRQQPALSIDLDAFALVGLDAVTMATMLATFDVRTTGR